jgi:hypothetical protein
VTRGARSLVTQLVVPSIVVNSLCVGPANVMPSKAGSLLLPAWLVRETISGERVAWENIINDEGRSSLFQ